MADLVKITRRDDLGVYGRSRNIVPLAEQTWCIIDPCAPGVQQTLCTKEVFGGADSAAEFRCKSVSDYRTAKGVCQKCLDIMKRYSEYR